jgi:hypothetical protein
MHKSFKIQTFQLTSNDSTLITENAIFPELGLYYSYHYRNIVEKLKMYCSCYSQYHIAIEKLLSLKTGLDNLESQRNMTFDASKVTC